MQIRYMDLHLRMCNSVVCTIELNRFQIYDLTCYPVDSDALHPANAVGDHILSPCLVSLRPADGAQAHVHPVDGVIL